jgi:hypothetical protein
MNQNNLSQANYLKIDANLVNNPKYQKLSTDGKFLYSLYATRMECSIYNSWIDEHDRYFIYFSNEEASDVLNISERKVTTLRNQLIELGLIEVVRNGLKNYRIYVSIPEVTPEKVAVKVTHKNYSNTKKRRIASKAAVINVSYTTSFEEKTAASTKEHLVANSASTGLQKLPLRTEQALEHQTTKTKDTRETQKTVAAIAPEDLQTTSVTPEVQRQHVLIDALIDKYQHLIPKNAIQRFLPFCKDSYKKTKWYFDTIFKAKFASTKAYLEAGLPAESLELSFEGNPYYAAGLSNAIGRAMEQIYRYKKVANPEGFFYTFMRGYFVERTKQYLSDQFEVNDRLETIFSKVSTPKKVARPAL